MDGHSKKMKESDERAGGHFRKLLIGHLPFIEKQCHKVCCVNRAAGPHGAGDIPGGYSVSTINGAAIDPDVLYLSVLNLLEVNDFKVLREFNGTSKLTTYLATVISHHFIDLVRKEKGRSRVKQRADSLGALGKMVYDLVFVRNHSVYETREALKVVHNVDCPEGDIRAMLDKMKVVHRAGAASMDIARGARNGGAADPWLIPDTKLDPERAVINERMGNLLRGLLKEVLDKLSGEDLLMLKLRYPEDGKEALTILAVGKLLGVPERTVEKRIRKALTRCREWVLEKGYRLEDFE